MSQQTFVNPKRTVVAINGSAGAVVAINSSKFCRYVEIAECAPGGGTFDDTNFAPQGANYELPDDGFVEQYPLLPGATLSLGDNSFGRDRGIGIPAGMTDPAGNAIGPVVYCKMISATVTATQVLVLEYS